MPNFIRTAAWAVPLVLAACSGSPTDANVPPAPAPLANNIQIVSGASTKGATAFSPNPKTVALGGVASAQVRWVNIDYSSSYNGTTSVTHHIVADDGVSFDLGNLDGNQTATRNLAAGSYPYHCAIHPSMVGTLTINP